MTEVNVLWTPEWYRTLFNCIKVAQKDVFLVSPWLKMAGAELILNALLENAAGKPQASLLTTLDDADLVESSRMSDLEAYMLLVSYGVDVRAVRGLHAKIYIFDDGQATVTSGNLTSRGLGFTNNCNLEVALHVNSVDVVGDLKAQLLPVWAASRALTPLRLKEVATHLMELNVGEEVVSPAHEPSAAVDVRLPPSFQATGKWWQGAGLSPSEPPLRMALKGSELLASVKLDSDLREAFGITREARLFGGQKTKTKSVVMPRPSLVRNTAPLKVEGTGTDLLPPLQDLKQSDFPPAELDNWEEELPTLEVDALPAHVEAVEKAHIHVPDNALGLSSGQLVANPLVDSKHELTLVERFERRRRHYRMTALLNWRTIKKVVQAFEASLGGPVPVDLTIDMMKKGEIP